MCLQPKTCNCIGLCSLRGACLIALAWSAELHVVAPRVVAGVDRTPEGTRAKPRAVAAQVLDDPPAEPDPRLSPPSPWRHPSTYTNGRPVRAVCFIGVRLRTVSRTLCSDKIRLIGDSHCYGSGAS